MLGFEKKTPFNTEKVKLRVLVGCLNFSELTGMPMYIYRLGKEFVQRGMEITVVSKKIGDVITDMATQAGIKVYQFDNTEYKGKEYDVLFLHETVSAFLLDQFPDIPAWNCIHSTMELDRPIKYRPQIRGYIAAKKRDAKHWRKHYDYDLEVVPIPIDFIKFKKRKSELHKEHRILAPCTLDSLRKPMLLALVKAASEDKNIKLRIVGKDYKALDGIALPTNVEVKNSTPNIVEEFAWADEIAGIYKGTVILEAWAMGKKTSVYDEKGNHKMVKPSKNFRKLHSIKNVADQYIKKFNEKWADIIIPHHDQADLLAQTLKSIPLRNYNVIISRGGTFSQNNNKGAKVAETNRLIFANDDLIINPQVLWGIVDSKEEIIGVQQFYPNGEPLCLGICFNKDGHYILTNEVNKILYPSGAFFAIKRKTFEKLGGFDERFINGAEDQDLFLRALEEGSTISFIQGSVIHYCSQSAGRFDYINENDKLLFSIWTPKRLEKLFGKDYKNG